MNNYNYITGFEYQGRNQVDLTVTREKASYKSEAWLTFLQARDKGLKIKKGSHGVSIFKGFKSFDEKDENGKIKVENRPVGFATVFNLEQTEKVKK